MHTIGEKKLEKVTKNYSKMAQLTSKCKQEHKSYDRIYVQLTRINTKIPPHMNFTRFLLTIPFI